MVHHVNVGLRVLNVSLDRFAGCQFTRYFFKTALTERSNIPYGALCLPPVHMDQKHARNKNQHEEQPGIPQPMIPEREPLRRGQGKPCQKIANHSERRLTEQSASDATQTYLAIHHDLFSLVTE
jgi:hypothetical protein